MANDNVIYIGSKNFMNYVTAVVMQFTTQNRPEVIVKARGKFIARAVDVAEVARKRFLKDLGVDFDQRLSGIPEYFGSGKKI